MTAILAHYGEAIGFRVSLDGVPNIAQVGSRLDLSNAAPHGFVTGTRQAPGQDGGIADKVHSAGIAMKSVANYRDIDIDDIAAFQALVAGDSVANDVVDRRTDGLREPPIVQIGRNGLQLIDDKVMAAL